MKRAILRRRRWILAMVVLLAAASTVWGQGGQRARGQIFLPNGQPIQEVTRYYLKSEDPRFDPEIMFTDSQGRFVLQGLGTNRWYTIEVESDGKRYATTAERFLGGSNQYWPVYLKELPATRVETKSPTISAAAMGHQPPVAAKTAYDEALKAIETKDYAEAKEKLRKAIFIDAGYVTAYNELAVVFLQEKNFTEAEKLLRRALEFDPVAPHPLMNLGIALTRQGKYAEAIPPLRQAIQQMPNWTSAHTYLGISLLQTDQLVEAETHLKRGTGAAGMDQAFAYLYLGMLYAQTGKVQPAIDAWESYLKMDSDSTNAAEVRRGLEQLRKQVPAAKAPAPN